MSTDPAQAGVETGQQRFERILSQSLFEGLKAILHRLSPDRATLYTGALSTHTYEELIGRLGYRLTLTGQIHVQDCYSRMGQGGIKAVLPYHDIPTQSSLPTLVNFDATVTTTPKAAAFFNALLGELKRQLGTQP